MNFIDLQLYIPSIDLWNGYHNYLVQFDCDFIVKSYASLCVSFIYFLKYILKIVDW